MHIPWRLDFETKSLIGACCLKAESRRGKCYLVLSQHIGVLLSLAYSDVVPLIWGIPIILGVAV